MKLIAIPVILIFGLWLRLHAAPPPVHHTSITVSSVAYLGDAKLSGEYSITYSVGSPTVTFHSSKQAYGVNGTFHKVPTTYPNTSFVTSANGQLTELRIGGTKLRISFP